MLKNYLRFEKSKIFIFDSRASDFNLKHLKWKLILEYVSSATTFVYQLDNIKVRIKS